MRDRNVHLFVYLWKVNKSKISFNHRMPEPMVFRKSHYKTCSCTNCWWQWRDHASSEVQVWASLSSLSRFPHEACFLRSSAGNIFSLLHLLCMCLGIARFDISRDWRGIVYPFAITYLQLEIMGWQTSSPPSQREGIVEEKFCQDVVHLSGQLEKWHIQLFLCLSNLLS